MGAWCGVCTSSMCICMHVFMHACIRCALCASEVDVQPHGQAAEACHVQDSGFTCLHSAARKGHIEVVKYLCEVWGKDLIMLFKEVRCDAMCVFVSGMPHDGSIHVLCVDG